MVYLVSVPDGEGATIPAAMCQGQEGEIALIIPLEGVEYGKPCQIPTCEVVFKHNYTWRQEWRDLIKSMTGRAPEPLKTPKQSARIASDEIETKTPQQTMREKLESVGLPYKRIEVYGRQIVVTCLSRDTAAQWLSLLARFANARGVVESIDECKTGGKLAPLSGRRYMPVWRAFANL